MKVKIFALLLAALAVGLSATTKDSADTAKLEFAEPTFETPFYRILGAFTIEKGTALIKSLDLNGTNPDSVLILRAGKPVDPAKALAPGVYQLVLTFGWRSGKTYTLTAAYLEDVPAAAARARNAAPAKTAAAKERKAVWTSTAPATGGIPEPFEEGFHAVFAVEEPAGIARESEIVCLAVTAPTAAIGEAQLSVLDKGQVLPSQVLERKETPRETEAASTQAATTTVKLGAAVSAAAHERKMLLVLKGGAPSVPGAGPVVSGQGPGRTARSSRIALGLDPQSGQISTIEFLKEKVKLHNEKMGVIHAGPDVFVPGLPWDRASDWNPPPSIAEKNGPLVYVNARKGPLPRAKDIYVEIRYELEQGAPYFLVETRATARKDLGVIALRNDQMVFARRLFDSLVYKDPVDGVVERPLLEMPDKPYGMVHVAPADAEWIGFINSFNRFGFFGVRISSLDLNMDAAGAFSHRAATYFYAPTEADYVAWVRSPLTTWGEYSTNTLPLFLPEGSEFYEKNAYLLLPMDESTPSALDDLARRLRNPLRVY
jgi:hypothetical protein